MNNQTIRRLLACLLALLSFLPLSACGTDAGDGIPDAEGSAPQTLRVLLTRLNLTDRLDVTLNGAYSAEFGQTSLMFGRGCDLTILLKDGRMVLYYAGMSAEGGAELTLRRHPVPEGTLNALQFPNNLSYYEGDLLVSVVEGKLRAILTLGAEDYLKGVVPYEMSDSYPLEALKAQAVAARTYALSRAVANAKKAYDLVDNTNDQVYRGRRDENGNAAAAVDGTAGVCGFSNGKLVKCYYSASNGGQTELASHVWETDADDSYLDMRDDPYDLANPQSKVISVTLPKRAAGVADTPYAVRLLLSRQLADTLTAQGYDPAPESLRVDTITAVSLDTPAYKEPSRLCTRLHITFTYSARTRTDAPAVWVDDDQQEVSLFTPEPATPAPVTPVPPAGETPTPSPAPSPTPSPTPAPSYGPFVPATEPVTLDIPMFPTAEKLLSLGINSSDNELFSVSEEADRFVVQSRRFGHGVGLSQRGAEWMAGIYGKSYVEILNFYYPGMTLMRYAQTDAALPSVAPALMETAGPVPTPTPRPTLMPVTQPLPAGAWYASVTEIDDDSSLNLRAAPDMSGEVLMKLYKNQQLIVLEECPQGDWVRVKTDAIEGYVMEKFLTQQNAQESPQP